ncbi:DUF6196 family protein [Allomuricauda sp. SCSIO 64092]|uniref:DUF6196 family protein n=1 Tax=Allomuricauda sp. SCSIO 64092 TaxID=2908842 RepID=UPI0039194FC6
MGAGVFMICGKNSRRGGIHDHRGCDWEMGRTGTEVVNYLRKTNSIEQKNESKTSCKIYLHKVSKFCTKPLCINQSSNFKMLEIKYL